MRGVRTLETRPLSDHSSLLVRGAGGVDVRRVVGSVGCRGAHVRTRGCRASIHRRHTPSTSSPHTRSIGGQGKPCLGRNQTGVCGLCGANLGEKEGSLLVEGKMERIREELDKVKASKEAMAKERSRCVTTTITVTLSSTPHSFSLPRLRTCFPLGGSYVR